MKHLIVIALVCAVLLFGCAGEQAGSTGQNAAQAPATNQQAQTGGQQAGQNQPQAPPAQQQGAKEDYLRMLGIGKTIEYKAAYDISTNANGQPVVTKMTQYMKGEDKIRLDTDYQGVEGRTYFLSNVLYMCTKQSGGWSCLKFSTQEDQMNKAKDDIEKNIADYQIIADGTMQVAGVTANCFKVTGKNIENYRSCYSSEGVPLYAKLDSGDGKATQTTEMTATSYSTNVLDSDFVLPAEATELTIPSGVGGAGAGASGDTCSYCSYLTGQDKTDCLASCAG